jgi:hypothetical protein
MENGREINLKSLQNNHTGRCAWSLNIHYYAAVKYYEQIFPQKCQLCGAT